MCVSRLVHVSTTKGAWPWCSTAASEMASKHAKGKELERRTIQLTHSLGFQKAASFLDGRRCRSPTTHQHTYYIQPPAASRLYMTRMYESHLSKAARFYDFTY